MKDYKECFSQSISNKEHFKGWTHVPCKGERRESRAGEAGRQGGSRNRSEGMRVRMRDSEMVMWEEGRRRGRREY